MPEADKRWKAKAQVKLGNGRRESGGWKSAAEREGEADHSQVEAD